MGTVLTAGTRCSSLTSAGGNPNPLLSDLKGLYPIELCNNALLRCFKRVKQRSNGRLKAVFVIRPF